MDRGSRPLPRLPHRTWRLAHATADLRRCCDVCAHRAGDARRARAVSGAHDALRAAERLTLLEPHTAISPPADDPRAFRLFVAPDAEEEVRLAIRMVLDHLAASQSRRELIGIAYTSATPYARVLAGQLTVAQIPGLRPGPRPLRAVWRSLCGAGAQLATLASRNRDEGFEKLQM